MLNFQFKLYMYMILVDMFSIMFAGSVERICNVDGWSPPNYELCVSNALLEISTQVRPGFLNLFKINNNYVLDTNVRIRLLRSGFSDDGYLFPSM